MAQQRTATLISSERLGDETKLLSFRMMDGELGFVGGQYIIVDTGIPIAGNKIAKRAYSILSTDVQQHEFQLGVRRIGQGPGSNFMHNLEIGDALRFSGPWGKFVAADSGGESVLVVATDTGITAALGLLRGHGLRSSRERSKLLWLAESNEYFLPFHFVISQLDEHGVHNFVMTDTTPVFHPARIERALSRIDETIASNLPKAAFLCGDGAVVYAARDRLIASGVDNENIRIECFFNNPERKTQPPVSANLVG